MFVIELLIACLMRATEVGRVQWRQGFSGNRYVAVVENGAVRIERIRSSVVLTVLDNRGMARLQFVCDSPNPGSPLRTLFHLVRATEQSDRDAVEEMLAELEG